MDRSITARRVALLVGDFTRRPAYAGLAEALILLIGDGRIPAGTRLPSERELTIELGVSRTTITRAYAAVREAGYAAARRGSGTYTRVPGRASNAQDRALLPRPHDRDAIDLNCAAPLAPPTIAGAYTEASTRLPAYLGGHGYFPTGLPELQAAVAAHYTSRGLPTAPEQVMITSGALAAVSILAQALVGRGDRVLVESPGYPNAAQRFGAVGARLATTDVDPDGWDLDATAARIREASPKLAYLIPDFHNPTGLLMEQPAREQYAALLHRAGTVAIVDESHALLSLDDAGPPMPPPFAAFSPDAITIGSASKAFWGGLRVGWVRAPLDRMDQLTSARVTLDLGVPVMEQLVTAVLLENPLPTLTEHRTRLREQRDALVTALGNAVPQWRFRVPEGGLSLWCELHGPGRGLGLALAREAELHGVIVAPGPVFAPGGGLDRFVRIPYTRRVEELERAVAGLAEAWEAVAGRRPMSSPSGGRVMVA